ncbi:four helix bundle protein [Algoriphagus sp. NF]|jgi:four helix bundle protein|uniref:four helix bundle protein n=1 Tax=Algoriphagus sp. NF TaxID=2992756 RepID=UPI000416F0EC|nr:four helix bundle protein [Algoriphagus sp. NF]MDE0559294.1 four helix bundle protein [Algoriphagus sp. NF]
MAKYERFEDLPIWQHALEIGVRIYKLVETEQLLKDYRAKDQLIGAAISISNNIAEGFEYNRNRQFIRYLEIAKGSAGELRSQLFLMMKAGKINQEIYDFNYKDLVLFSSAVKGLIKYLKEFEKNRKRKG